jgi:predicted nucleotidyltransferase
LDKAGLTYMVVGGYALPFYGAIRTTLDIDLAVRVRHEKEFEALCAAAQAAGLRRTVGSFIDGLCVFAEAESGLEIEVWMKLDGMVWDAETVARRTKQRMGGVEIWVISPEDFMVTKLARKDRGVQDEKDVRSVLERLGSSLDRRYLKRRARRAGVESLLRAIEGSS